MPPNKAPPKPAAEVLRKLSRFSVNIQVCEVGTTRAVRSESGGEAQGTGCNDSRRAAPLSQQTYSHSARSGLRDDAGSHGRFHYRAEVRLPLKLDLKAITAQQEAAR